MRANIVYHTDRRFKKPFTVSIDLEDDQGIVSGSTDVHGRFTNASEARKQAMLWLNVADYRESWGETKLNSEPPQIITEAD